MSEIKAVYSKLPSLLSLILIAAGAAFFFPGAPAYAQETTYLYSIWYNGKRIGEHEFVVARSPEGTRVRSAARMEYRVLFVPLYRYTHVAEEQWQDGCLAELSAETDDNGTLHAVRASAGPAGLSVDKNPDQLGQDHSRTETQILSADCVASFAYWDLDLLQRKTLLNAQTGELAPAALISQGTEDLRGLQAERYVLQAEGLTPIRLWYRNSDRRWLQLETERDGGTLTYRFEREKQSTLLAQQPARG